MFDAPDYVLGLYFYCSWSLVLFWALFAAFWWRFLGWRHRLQCIFIVQPFLRLLKLHKLAVGKLDLLLIATQCHGMIDHGLNLCREYPFKGPVHIYAKSSVVNIEIKHLHLGFTLSLPTVHVDRSHHQWQRCVCVCVCVCVWLNI